MYSYVIRMSLVCPRMYSYVICVSLVCTRMPSVCHSMSSVCTRMSPVCHSYVVMCMSPVCKQGDNVFNYDGPKLTEIEGSKNETVSLK